MQKVCNLYRLVQTHIRLYIWRGWSGSRLVASALRLIPLQQYSVTLQCDYFMYSMTLGVVLFQSAFSVTLSDFYAECRQCNMQTIRDNQKCISEAICRKVMMISKQSYFGKCKVQNMNYTQCTYLNLNRLN